MRKQLVALICVLFSAQTFAASNNSAQLSNRETQDKVEQVLNDLRTPLSLSQKMLILNGLKKFLFNQMNSIDESYAMTHPEEYASLAEFDTYINMIEPSQSCGNIQTHMHAAAAGNGSAVEFQIAQKILTALCQK